MERRPHIVLQILRSPWMAAGLGLGLLIHGASQPWTTSVGGALEPRRTHCFFPRTMYVSRDVAGALRVHAEEEGDAQGVRVWTNYREYKTGFWCPTGRRTDTTLHIDDYEFAESLTVAERTVIRLAYADRLKDAGLPAALTAPLSAGEGVTVTPIASGYVKDAVVVVAAVLALHAMVFVPSHVAAFVVRDRRARAALSGLCARCGYDMSGLPGPVCPECGHDPTDHDEHYF